MIAWKSLFRNPADRSHLAGQTAQTLRQDGWITSIIQQSHHVAASLHGCSGGQLRAHTERLALSIRKDTEAADPQLLALAAGGVIEAIRQTLSLNLFDVQLHAGIAVSCGAVAEMQTGEGKTLAGVLPAYVHALQGRGVHVATTNAYLADRDHGQLSPVFGLLGMTTGLLADDASAEQTRAAYRADVTFGPGHAFGFDFLRDQLVLSQAEAEPLGTGVYRSICGAPLQNQLRQRPLHAAIVDEVDHVLIDDAVSPLILSSSGKGEAPDAEIHLQAHWVASHLTHDRDYVIEFANKLVQLSEHGFQKVYQDDQFATHPKLVRPWHEYVILALRAEHFFQRDVHYVVNAEEVQIVDESTGRIFQDRSWSDGLHQAVEAAENLTITPENASLARITRQRFYRHYEVLGGMTGTATGCEREFASVYGLAVCTVPLRTPSRRSIQPQCICKCQASKFQAIAEEAQQLIQRGRAVLIGTLNIAQSQAIAGELDRRGLTYQLLNGVQDAEEAAVIADAGQQRAITVATNLAGRGTDIKLDPSVRNSGGLHVIVTEHHSLRRVDRQLIGRCARCGDPGSARVYLSPDDELFGRHAPWISRAIERHSASMPFSEPIAKQIQRSQTEMQSKAASIRWQMLQLDRENESLLQPAQDLTGCWQM